MRPGGDFVASIVGAGGNFMNAAKSACIRSAIDAVWPRKIA